MRLYKNPEEKIENWPENLKILEITRELEEAVIRLRHCEINAKKANKKTQNDAGSCRDLPKAQRTSSRSRRSNLADCCFSFSLHFLYLLVERREREIEERKLFVLAYTNPSPLCLSLSSPNLNDRGKIEEGEEEEENNK